LGTVSPLIAACGSDEDEPDEPGPASGTTDNTPLPEAESTSPASAENEPTTGDAATEGEPVSGGTLTFGEYSEPPIMDPRVSGATIAWRLFYNIFDPLLVQDTETGDFLPGLADTWEISEDGLVYTLGLKEGVTFHDGTDFNAEAVKFTFDSILEPELKSPRCISLTLTRRF
jgi:peptide/nickel transport system substrate-binding protein